MKNSVIGAIIIFVALTASLVGFSLLIGWNLITAILFWFVITPAIAYFIPGAVLKDGNFLQSSLFGVALFYSGMVFMIYHHYQSDYFQLILLSLAINILVLIVLHRFRERRISSR